MKTLTVIGTRPYAHVREDCHALKGARSVHDTVVERCAGRIAPELGDCILVPVPSHKGAATDTLLLSEAIKANLVSRGHTCLVLDVLRAEPHRPLHEAKHDDDDAWSIGIHIRCRQCADMDRLRSNAAMPEDAKLSVLLVDNVIDTGRTVEACMHAFPFDGIAAVGDTQEWKGRISETP